MDVKHVLASKNVSGVISVGPQETIASLTKKLAEMKIGAVVVLDEAEKLVGVISERDIVRALSEAGGACLHSPISAYMTASVKTASPKDNVFAVLDQMTEGRFRHMPVLENERVVGVISIGDVVKARIEALQADNAALEEFIRS